MSTHVNSPSQPADIQSIMNPVGNEEIGAHTARHDTELPPVLASNSGQVSRQNTKTIFLSSLDDLSLTYSWHNSLLGVLGICSSNREVCSLISTRPYVLCNSSRSRHIKTTVTPHTASEGVSSILLVET